jgi:glycopeptide antibiotics resistance protein
MASSHNSSTGFRLASAILLTAYTALVAYWMLIGFGRVEQAAYHYNLKPLYTITQYLHIRHSHTRLSAINLLGNVAVFVPFGIMIPLAFPHRRTFWGRFGQMLGIFLLGDLLLESIQLVTKRGSFDVDDFLLNTVGALIGFVGYLIWRGILRQMRGRDSQAALR